MSSLTKREREVVGLLAQGLRRAEIARRLCISMCTVDAHLAAARYKSGSRSSLVLATRAAREQAVNGD